MRLVLDVGRRGQPSRFARRCATVIQRSPPYSNATESRLTVGWRSRRVPWALTAYGAQKSKGEGDDRRGIGGTLKEGREAHGILWRYTVVGKRGGRARGFHRARRAAYLPRASAPGVRARCRRLETCQIPARHARRSRSASRVAALCQLVSTACCAAARVSFLDRRRDRLVLFDRRRQLVQQHVDIEPRVSLTLRLDRAMEGDDARPATPSTYVAWNSRSRSNRPRAGPCARRRRELAVHGAEALTISFRRSAGSDAASRAANPSRWPTMRNNSRPSPRVSGVTISRWSPARPTEATKPSCCRRCSALRTGVRLRPIRATTARSATRAPEAVGRRRSACAAHYKRARRCRPARAASRRGSCGRRRAAGGVRLGESSRSMRARGATYSPNKTTASWRSRCDEANGRRDLVTQPIHWYTKMVYRGGNRSITCLGSRPAVTRSARRIVSPQARTECCASTASRCVRSISP